MTLRIAVVGASGRMGRAVVRLLTESGDAKVVAAIAGTELGRDVGEVAGVGALGTTITPDLSFVAAGEPDVVIDFSTPALTGELVAHCMRDGIALVSGTTGLDAMCKSALEGAAHSTAVLWEPNMSLGMLVLSQLVRAAADALGPAFDVEIVEAHHRNKVDAPSGTALRLAEVARREGHGYVYGRSGTPGARSRGEIGVHAVRGGDVLGDHTVHFMGDGERLELTHRATNRDVFAHGAIRAARWMAGRPPGLYTLADVVNGRT